MELKITDIKYWDTFKAKVKELGIFDTDQYNDSFLKRRVLVRLRNVNTGSLFNYSKLLSESSQERTLLLKELTIHVTHFFRDSSVFDMIKDDVLPILTHIKKADHDYNLKIWCAGCSTGEEPYSMAIILKEFFEDKPTKFKIKFIANDIDKASIEKAKEGIYDANQLMETKNEIISKYFIKVSGQYKIVDEIKEMVEFSVGNFLSKEMPKELDMILCRNVVIYFDGDTKKTLYDHFFDVLKKGGFYIMGKTESLMGNKKDFFQIYNATEKIYFKE